MHTKLRTLVWSLAILAAATAGARAEVTDADIGRHSRALLFADGEAFDAAVATLGSRGKVDAAAALILALRYRRDRRDVLSGALESITGHQGEGWFDWMVWQETHLQITPHPTFTPLKLELLSRLDPDFLEFFEDGRADRAAMKIRLEEITWGGVGALDGIPSLDRPRMIAAEEAAYLRDQDLVFGIALNGDLRAYPLRIMGWHEMFNDVIGRVPVALAYCTLCGSGILYETQLPGRANPLVFGSSGLLYRSNKLMFDWQSKSLWNQFTGRPVVGPLTQSDIVLKTRPVVITSWANWRDRHPETTVLDLETGYRRDYGPGVVYRDYFASPGLMFPAAVQIAAPLGQKDYVFGIRTVGAAKAWPLDAFEGGAVINDRVGNLPVVLLGDSATRSVRAYERGPDRFAPSNRADALDGPGGIWTIEEDALTGPDGTRLARVAGSISYWFAWDGYLGSESTLYTGAAQE